MKRGPRWMHCAIAFFGGFFWLPCPVCGRMFGGHEAEAGMTYWTDPAGANPRKGRSVCSEGCAMAVEVVDDGGHDDG